MNQQQCKILYDFGGHLENMQISSIRRHFSACKHSFSDLAYQITLKKCVRPLSSEISPYLILLKFVFRDSVFCVYKVISPFSNMALPISECATPKKLSVDIYLQLKTSFIL